MMVFELFAGIGAQRQALKELGIEHEAIFSKMYLTRKTQRSLMDF